MNIIEKLQEILLSVNPEISVEGVGEKTDLTADLHLDSLNMMLLAVAIEDEFGFRFDDMPTFQTVGDIACYIKEKTGI